MRRCCLLHIMRQSGTHYFSYVMLDRKLYRNREAVCWIVFTFSFFQYMYLLLFWKCWAKNWTLWLIFKIHIFDFQIERSNSVRGNMTYSASVTFLLIMHVELVGECTMHIEFERMPTFLCSLLFMALFGRKTFTNISHRYFVAGRCRWVPSLFVGLPQCKTAYVSYFMDSIIKMGAFLAFRYLINFLNQTTESQSK